jgi:hypothetical protein
MNGTKLQALQMNVITLSLIAYPSSSCEGYLFPFDDIVRRILRPQLYVLKLELREPTEVIPIELS